MGPRPSPKAGNDCVESVELLNPDFADTGLDLTDENHFVGAVASGLDGYDV